MIQLKIVLHIAAKNIMIQYTITEMSIYIDIFIQYHDIILASGCISTLERAV